MHVVHGFEPSRRAAADLHLCPRGHWDRHCNCLAGQINHLKHIILDFGNQHEHTCWFQYAIFVQYCQLILWGVRFSAPIQTGPGAHPASYTMGTRSFSGVKRSVRGVDHPLPSSTEVKERVELYIYSPSGPSWPVLGWYFCRLCEVFIPKTELWFFNNTQNSHPSRSK
jgi:hypothetical protein